MNEEPDSACARCGELRPAALLTEAPRAGEGTTVNPVQTPVALASPQPSPRARRSRLPLVLTLLLLLLGGGALVYAAWLRGLIDLPPQIAELLPQADLPLPALPAGEATTAPSAPTAAEKLLEGLEGLPPRQLRLLKDAVERLAATQTLLDAVERQAVPGENDSAARDGQLTALRAIHPELVADYNAFEDAAGKISAPEAQEDIAALRGEFTVQLGRFLDLLGRSYLNDPDVARVDYMLSDQLQQAVGLRGRIPADELKQHWVAAVTAREQRLMDAKYPVEYEALAARLATLRQLRRDFNAAAQALPPASTERGHLTDAAAALLTLYDSFAYKLEDLWDEWVVFEATLPTISEQPQRMSEQIKTIRELFYSEHLDCFTQMYKIYASDSDLTHVAYEHLISDHYEFVKAEWVSRIGQYEAVFHQYEAEWDRNFRPNRNRSEAESGPSAPDLRGPPGYVPEGPPGS